MANLGIQRNRTQKLWLNEYSSAPTLRIEGAPGGFRCLWKEKTTTKKMESTRNFLSKTWKRNA